MKRRHKFRAIVRGLLASLLIAVLTGPAVFAAEQPGSRADLYEMFAIDQVGADIVVAVDTSLSMKDDFSVVRRALDSFSRALGPQDQLTIIVFDNHARKVYEGRADRADKVSAAFPKAPDPRGQKTNMGEAVDLVLRELEGESGKLPVVLFVSDGMEDPPPESEFAVRPGEAWRNLKDRAASDPNTKGAYVHGIGLNANTDIDKLQQIWPRARPISVTASDLNVYFKQLKERIRRQRLRHAVRQELEQGRVTVRFNETNWGALRPGTTKKEEIVMTSTYKKLPIDIDLTGLTWGRFGSLSGREDGGRPPSPPRLEPGVKHFTLAPGQSRTIPVKITVAGAEPGKIKLKEEEEWRGRLKVELTAATPVAEKISDLRVEPRVKLAGREREIFFTRSTGIALYIFAAFGIAALAGLWFAGRYGLTPAGQLVYRRFVAPPLFGRLAFAAVPPGMKLPRPVNLEGLGRKATLGTAGAIKLDGNDIKPAHAEIFTNWEEGEARLMVRPREGTVKVARSPASAPTIITDDTELRPGGVIQIGEYKIQWS